MVPKNSSEDGEKKPKKWKIVLYSAGPTTLKVFKKVRLPKKIKFPNIKSPRFWRRVLAATVVLMLIGMGTALGIYLALLKNLPSIEVLATYEPPIITYIYDAKGEVIKEYALQKRIEIDNEDIPEILKNAIVATEDPRFYKHNGIDFLGILRAAREDLRLGRGAKLHGGSTISQQLIRTILLHRGQTIRRKLKEAILSLKLENRYSKEEILTMYCNQFWLGGDAYGVEAAAQLYFEKPASELTLVEAAMITGIFRGPGVYSPYRQPDRTKERRNHVLNRMRDEGYITTGICDETKQLPLGVLPQYRSNSESAAYFTEEVRKYIEQNYGTDALYHSGLKVYTTLDSDYQRYSEKALKQGLRVVDKGQGWRKDKPNLIDSGVENLEELEKPFKSPKDDQIIFLRSWYAPELMAGEIIEAVVLEAGTRTATVKIKDNIGKISNGDIAWTRSSSLKSLLKRGDIIHVKIKSIDAEKKELQLSLDQEPILEGAFLAIEPQTGQIKAMVGGYSFQRLKWNQATQAARQTGSVIKPMIYTAALENTFTPASIIVDEPTKFEDRWAEKPYEPGNYDQKYKGAVTLRTGLEESRNIITTKILEYISPQTGVDYVRKFGITAQIYPYLSLALGSFEIKLIEMVSAFTTFPNKGVRVPPYFITRIEDRDNNILEETMTKREEVISPQTAYMMVRLMQGVILRGTSTLAAPLLEWKELAGKTGTTDEHSDAWFIGYSPSLCAGVWVGHEKEVRTIGERQSGAVVALPIWRDFFQQIIDKEVKDAEENGEEYQREVFDDPPPNLNFVYIDRKTGLLPSNICLPQYIIEEVFLPGTEPTRHCTYEDHMMTYDYYSILK